MVQEVRAGKCKEDKPAGEPQSLQEIAAQEDVHAVPNSAVVPDHCRAGPVILAHAVANVVTNRLVQTGAVAS